jgi:ribosome-binding factor A
MAGHRIERVNEQLKREISRIVIGEVADPRVGGATVTRVSAAPDLTFARVHVQILGDEAERAETLKGLRAAGAFIRRALAGRLSMRRVPELRFEEDRSLERLKRIETLLAEAAGTGEEEPAPGTSAEAEPDGAEGPKDPA